MLGFNGGLLGVRKVPTTGAASGLWVPNEQSVAQRAGIWPAGPASIPDIGQAFGGGFFAGYISHTANSAATHALIVGPSATAASGSDYSVSTDLGYKTSATSTSETNPSNVPAAEYDGRLNTDALITLGIATFPAAQFCVNLTVGGFTDWYLPARYELEIAYYNLKPTTQTNNTSYGGNPYSVPARGSTYTSGTPAMASGSAAAFDSSGAQRFSSVNGVPHLTSTSYFQYVREISFRDGFTQRDAYAANVGLCVRAFRRVAL